MDTKYTPIELEAKGQQYIDDCIANKEPVLMTGLARACGFYDRVTFWRYSKKDDYQQPIKKLKLQVEQYAEGKLYSSTPTGAIFTLKNMGWTDQQQLSGTVELKVVKDR